MRSLAVDNRVAGHRISECINCGKCTWACPVSHRTGDFSPRKIAEEYLVSGAVPRDKGLWACTTCAMCSELCASGVEFHEFVREVRPDLRQRLLADTTHGGIFHAIQSLSSHPHVSPRKGDWVMQGMQIDPESSTLLFVGCTPFFDVVFGHIRADLLDIPRSSVALMNAMGVKPRLLEAERCCGHDAYWLGDHDTFLRLAEANVRAIEAAGVDRVVAFCPECYSTIKSVYPKFLGPLGFEVVSLTGLVGEAVAEGRMDLSATGLTYTYQDPCRLARHGGIVEEPRSILRRVGSLAELPRSGALAACCGTSCWTNCGGSTKEWQLERLDETTRTGADALVTACPKCLIHLECAQHEHPEGAARRRVQMVDIHVLAASRIAGVPRRSTSP